MAVLVTGGAGYIGSHMVHELLDTGQYPVVVDNLSTGLRSAVPHTVPFYEGDIGDSELCAHVLRLHDVNAIIHFAASTIAPESVSDPLSYYSNNTCQSLSLIRSAIESGIQCFVFSSTAAVYGNPNVSAVCEQDLTIPISPYGASKLMVETILRDVGATNGMPYAILRYFNVAGADPAMRAGQSSPKCTHLIRTAVRAALGMSKLEVFGTDYPTPDGTCIRDYIHVSDLVRAHSAALSYVRDRKTSIVLNCGYGRGFSVLEVLSAVQRVVGRTLEFRLGARRPGDPAKVVSDCRLIKATLDWSPKYDHLDLMISHALAWEIALQERYQKK